MKFTIAAATAAFVMSAVSAGASEYEAPLLALTEEQIKVWAQDADLISAVKAQNAETEGLSDADIDAMDKAWRAEVGADASPTIDKVAAVDASAKLVELREASEGLVTEIFIMDAKGLNVAMSDVTSDYFQGDEAKWQETFLKGADAVHLGEVELDESTQTYQTQISVSLADPETGDAIGAMTVGVALEFLE